MSRIGFIQSRGMGDIVIALPIALHYREQGHQVVWPICEEFMVNVERHVPWVEWVPLKVENPQTSPPHHQGRFFFFRPMQLLKYTTDEVINLMQFLSNRPQDSDPNLFPILGFDQYKYAKAGVPFKNKMRLLECITRDPVAERALIKRAVKGDRPYIVTHLTGSDVRADLDFSEAEDQGYQVIRVEDHAGFSIFDWIPLLNDADSLYLIDSCFANMVDQLDLGRDKWFIRRSKMDLTPVLLSDWNYFPLSPPNDPGRPWYL